MTLRDCDQNEVTAISCLQQYVSTLLSHTCTNAASLYRLKLAPADLQKRESESTLSISSRDMRSNSNYYKMDLYVMVRLASCWLLLRQSI